MRPLFISTDDIQDTLLHPAHTEIVSLGGGKTLSFFLGASGPRRPSPLLVQGEIVSGCLLVHMALPMACWEELNDRDLTPTEALRQFAEHFGFDVSIAGVRRRFFLSGTVAADSDDL